MSERSSRILKCDCGKNVDPGSVFCADCKAVIKKQNTKIISRELEIYNRKYFARV